MKDYEWSNPPQGLALCIASFRIPKFLFSCTSFLKFHGKKTNTKTLEQIIVGSKLVLTAFSCLNAFIYKLASE